MKFRHELKYRVRYLDYIAIRMRLAEILAEDPNADKDGSYTVRSLYFDDYFNSAYNEKYAGIMNRQKFRIRVYNHSEETIRLERKIKSDRYIYKETAPLTKEEVSLIMDGQYDFLLSSPHKALQVFYHECVSNYLRPRVVIDYEREAYVMDEGTLRLTFDKNVRAGREGFDIFNDEMSMVEVLEPGVLIMEVKYTEFAPKMLRKILPSKATDYSAVSKYILSCDKTLYKKRSYI